MSDDLEPDRVTTGQGLPKPRSAQAAGIQMQGVVKSAQRVLELFEFFAEHRRPLAVSDVVRGLGYPQSSASMLLKSLTKLGYLDYDRHARLFVPTLRLAFLGGWVHDQLFSQSSLSRMVDELREVCGETVIIGMQNETYVQYIHLLQSPHSKLKWYIKPGSLRPLARASVGKILLSRQRDVDVLYLLRRINAEEIEPRHRIEPGELLRQLDEIRRVGYAYSEGTVNPEAGVIAVELPTPPSQPPMAIGIGAPIETLRRERERFICLLDESLRPYRRPGLDAVRPK